MKTRYTGYNDYGFTAGEEKRLKELCQTKDFKIMMLVYLAAYRTNPGIATDLAYSLLNDLSYEKIEFTHTVPIGKGDFYAHRRKCLFFFKKALEKSKVHTTQQKNAFIIKTVEGGNGDNIHK